MSANPNAARRSLSSHFLSFNSSPVDRPVSPFTRAGVYDIIGPCERRWQLGASGATPQDVARSPMLAASAHPRRRAPPNRLKNAVRPSGLLRSSVTVRDFGSANEGPLVDHNARRLSLHGLTKG